MRYRLSQIKIDPLKVAAHGGGIDKELLMGQLEKSIGRAVCKELKCGQKSGVSGISGRAEVKNISIVRESVDARKKPDVKLVYTADFDCDGELPVGGKSIFGEGTIREYSLEKAVAARIGAETGICDCQLAARELIRPVIAGFGPCGIFAGLILAEAGLKPIILERGKPVDERVADVENFWRQCENSTEGTICPDPESNVQFGEGGAGTFSDGKLTTGIKDVRIRKVLQEFVEAGASEEILYRHKPHIGTDRLRDVVKNIRHKIESLGGEVRFGSRLENLIIEDGCLKGVEVGPDDSCFLPADSLILAVGHSARDTFGMLHESGFDMQQKAFSIGVRIEHPQTMIDKAQYGNPELTEILGPADYKLSYKCSGGRGVYTFCMCPGGQVVNASTEPGTSVTNGMSNSARDGEYANSAVLVDVRTADFAETDYPLAGLEFQKKYEKLAWENRTYKGMARTTFGEFRNEMVTSSGKQAEHDKTLSGNAVKNSIPAFASEAIMEAMPYFGKRLYGFDSDDAIMTAVESRSSSPVKVMRDENLEALINGQPVHGIIPAGEGPGYAGGIMSAAVDGIRAAEAVIAGMIDS